MVGGGSAAPYQTETYVFPNAVATQPAAPAGFPSTWVGSLDGQGTATADYSMSSVPNYTTQQIASALASLPMMSLVTTNANMFGPDGIYANSQDKTLEMPGSFEYFNPLSGTTSFGSLAEISMYGGVGRDTQYLKHGMEVHFESSEGKTYLNENIFGDGYLPDGLVLRQGFNDGWSWGGANTQFIIDQWTRDALTALGTQNTPGIWVQLFVNGLYWGVYNAVADIDSDYASYFFGGDASDYDVYHYSGTGFEVKSGSMAGWDDMFNVARYGNVAGTGTMSPTVLANPTAYALMAQYLNLPSFCDYMIVNYYGGNWDWDMHNYSALYSTTAGTGFIFQDWDGEGMLQSTGGNILNRYDSGDPTELFVQLMANPDFRQMFADHVYADLSTVLSPAAAAAMYQKEANTISAGVVDESARWGNLGELDGTWNQMGTPATWTTKLDWELGSVFPTRTATMYSQFETAVTFSPSPEGGSETYTMYPSFAPPVLYVNGAVENGGPFTPGNLLTMSMSAPAGAIIYYTTDGSDPRSGSSDFTVSSITLSGTTATVTLEGASTGLANGAEIYIGGAAQSQYDGEFAIANVSVNSLAGTTTFTCTVSGSPASPATPLAGQSLIASTPSSGGPAATAIQYSGVITLTQGETINARVLSGGAWSGLNSSMFYVNLAPYIRITELMYAPAPATAAEIAAGYASIDGAEDFEFVELQNIGTTTLALQGLAFTNGVSFTFPNVSLAAGQYIVACSDPAAFAIRYGSTILQNEYGANWLSEAGYSGHFNNGGEEVTLDSPGGIIEDFSYSNSWYPQTDGEGFSLVVQSASAALSLLASSSGWEAGGTPNGTPGSAETVALPPPGSIVVNEAMSNPSAVVPGDMIEFYNTTSQAINIGQWFVSDSSADLTKYQIAPGTVIAAYGYYVLTQDYNFGKLASSDPGRLVPFGLDPDGDTVYLSNNYGAPSGSYGGQAGGYQEQQTIHSMPSGYSYGLYTKSDGGADLSILSITLSGTTATVTLNNNTSTTLQNGESIYIEGATQAQYNGNFVIANVVNSTAGTTTTFTYTVIGSPASPAVPVAGESLYAMTGSTNFTLLATPSFGTLSGTTYSGAANSIPYVSPLVTDEIMYNPTQPTVAEAAAGYVANDFEYVELYNRSSSPVALGDYYVTGGVGYTPGWLADGSLANNLPVSSITGQPLAGGGTTATVTVSSTSTGFQNGQQIHIDGAAQSQYDGDFAIANVTVNSAAGTTTFTYTVNGAPASPATPAAGQSLAAGADSEFETLESGATATWSAASMASAAYTVYAHLNLYDGDNNPLSLDSSAQYTVTCGSAQTSVLVNQDQVPAAFSVTSLTYDNTTGVVTAAAAGTGLSAGSIVHISGATPSQYDGTFVVQSGDSSTFTYTLASGLNLAAATGTITAGLNDVWVSLGTYTLTGAVSVELTRTTDAKASEWTVAGGMELVNGQQTTVLGVPTFSSYSIQHPVPTLAPGAVRGAGEQLRGLRGTL